MAQQFANGVRLAGVEPVVAGHAQQQRADRFPQRWPEIWGKLLQVGDGEGVEERIGGRRDPALRLPHLGEGRRAGRLPIPHERVEPRHDRRLSLALQPVALLLVG